MSLKFSLKMNIFNEAKLLNEVIEYQKDFFDEIIIVEGAVGTNKLFSKNNHSTDGTLKILEKYKKDKKIKIFTRKEFKDLKEMEEVGRQLCTGDYIFRGAGDMVYLKKDIEKLRNILKNKKYDWVGIGVYNFFDLGNYIKAENKNHEFCFRNRPYFRYITSPHNVQNEKTMEWIFMAQSPHYKRIDLHDEINIFHYGWLDIFYVERLRKLLYQHWRDKWDIQNIFERHPLFKDDFSLKSFYRRHPEIIEKKILELKKIQEHKFITAKELFYMRRNEVKEIAKKRGIDVKSMRNKGDWIKQILEQEKKELLKQDERFRKIYKVLLEKQKNRNIIKPKVTIDGKQIGG